MHPPPPPQKFRKWTRTDIKWPKQHQLRGLDLRWPQHKPSKDEIWTTFQLFYDTIYIYMLARYLLSKDYFSDSGK